MFCRLEQTDFISLVIGDWLKEFKF